MSMTIKIEGVEELSIKFTRFYNFLGKEYNNAFRNIGKYGAITFKEHIDHHKTKSGTKWKRTKDLTEKYAEQKEKRWGKRYPILRASDKMYYDIKYKMNLKWSKYKTNKMSLSFGFKTKRSEKIAGYHVKGIKRKSGMRVKRNPWFWTTGEKSWVTKILKKSVKTALRKARLKTI